MAEKERSSSNLELIGGRLCLDFANTLSTWQEGGREYLISYVDLVAWSQHAGALRRQSAGRTDLAATALERAIGVRETVYSPARRRRP